MKEDSFSRAEMNCAAVPRRVESGTWRIPVLAGNVPKPQGLVSDSTVAESLKGYLWRLVLCPDLHPSRFVLETTARGHAWPSGTGLIVGRPVPSQQ